MCKGFLMDLNHNHHCREICHTHTHPYRFHYTSTTDLMEASRSLSNDAPPQKPEHVFWAIPMSGSPRGPTTCLALLVLRCGAASGLVNIVARTEWTECVWHIYIEVVDLGSMYVVLCQSHTWSGPGIGSIARHFESGTKKGTFD